MGCTQNRNSKNEQVNNNGGGGFYKETVDKSSPEYQCNQWESDRLVMVDNMFKCKYPVYGSNFTHAKATMVPGRLGTKPFMLAIHSSLIMQTLETLVLSKVLLWLLLLLLQLFTKAFLSHLQLGLKGRETLFCFLVLNSSKRSASSRAP